MNKKLNIILIIAGALFLLGGFYQLFLKDKKPEFDLFEVRRGNIVQEIFESGQVKKGERINLAFKNAGRIEEIYVEVGDEVKAGQKLAKLDTKDLELQLREVEAAFSLAQAQLDRLLAGATAEEIKIAQTEVQNKQTALLAVEQILQDAYEGSINVLNNVYLKTYNVQNVVSLFQRTYFWDGIRIEKSEEAIKGAVLKIESYLNQARDYPVQEDIDGILKEVKDELLLISGLLKEIRELCENPIFRHAVSSADKASLDTERAVMNVIIADITNLQSTIISARLSVESAEGNLQAAKDNLALVTTSPRQEDIVYYRANLEKARVRVELLKTQIEESFLRSSVQGQVIEIKKRIGELAQPTSQDVIMVILPLVPYEIKVDIYEGDVVKISIGNPVEISLIAFPGEKFKGKVTSISPAEKAIDGVVYYEVIVSLEEAPENIRPTMTADVVIQPDVKEDVLIIHRNALQRRNGRTVVEVFKEGLIKEREIEIGIRGVDDMMEVLSGLKEGEEVIIWR